MARNLRPVSEAPLHDSSSEEEEEESDEEEADQSSSQEEPQPTADTASTPKKHQPTPTSSAPNKQQPTPRTIDSDDSPPTTATRRSDPIIKPMADPPKPTKVSTPDPTPSSPPPKSAIKRPAAENDAALNSKRAKKKQKGKGKEVAAVIYNNQAMPKKGSKRRVWSEDDEIAVLKGLLEFRAKKGCDPMSNLNAFYTFVTKSLHLVDVTQAQFSTRLIRIKKKFKNNFKRGKDVFSNPHEQHTYYWSKKIWGEESDGLDVGNADKGGNGKGKKNGKDLSGVDEDGGDRVEEEANGRAKRAIGLHCSVEEFVMKDGLELVSESQKLEMMEKWRQFRVKEVELYLMRLELVREQAHLVLEALKN